MTLVTFGQSRNYSTRNTLRFAASNKNPKRFIIPEPLQAPDMLIIRPSSAVTKDTLASDLKLAELTALIPEPIRRMLATIYNTPTYGTLPPKATASPSISSLDSGLDLSTMDLEDITPHRMELPLRTIAGPIPVGKDRLSFTDRLIFLQQFTEPLRNHFLYEAGQPNGNNVANKAREKALSRAAKKSPDSKILKFPVTITNRPITEDANFRQKFMPERTRNIAEAQLNGIQFEEELAHTVLLLKWMGVKPIGNKQLSRIEKALTRRELKNGQGSWWHKIDKRTKQPPEPIILSDKLKYRLMLTGLPNMLNLVSLTVRRHYLPVDYSNTVI